MAPIALISFDKSRERRKGWRGCKAVLFNLKLGFRVNTRNLRTVN
jgi:hypothetical protein